MRLTNEIRDRFINKVLEATFQERQAALKTRLHAWATEVYESYYTPELLAIMAKLPEVLFLQQSSVRIHYRGYDKHESLPTTRLMGEIHRWGCFDLSPEQESVFRALDQARDQLKKDRSDLKEQLRKVAYSANTSNQLITKWPEAEAYLPKEAPKLANPPAEVLPDLNGLIAQYRGQAGA